jgi:hypothetical protein
MFKFWKRENTFRAEPKEYSLEELRQYLSLDSEDETEEVYDEARD